MSHLVCLSLTTTPASLSLFVCVSVCLCVHVQVHWNWDLSEFLGGTCKKENGTIVSGSEGAMGKQVASCKAQGHNLTLYCQVNATAASSASASGATTGSAGALSLQVHFTLHRQWLSTTPSHYPHGRFLPCKSSNKSRV
jgi:hypothetical protein